MSDQTPVPATSFETILSESSQTEQTEQTQIQTEPAQDVVTVSRGEYEAQLAEIESLRAKLEEAKLAGFIVLPTSKDLFRIGKHPERADTIGRAPAPVAPTADFQAALALAAKAAVLGVNVQK